MKHIKWLAIIGLVIAVTACNGGSDQPVGESGSQTKSDTSQDTSYTEKAKEFGVATAEKSKELYDKTSGKAKEIGVATVEKSKEFYDTASEKTREVYDKATE